MVFQNKTKEKADGQDLLITTDLGAVTALISNGCEFVRINKQNPKKVEFVFVRSIAVEELLRGYWSDNLLVHARLYFDNLKMLKSRIYEN